MMGKTTGIDYADASWSPWYGCTLVSAGCQHCYAEREMKWHGIDFNTVTRAADKTFNAPLHWKEPKKIFVCPWGDFFHEAADEWRQEALWIMEGESRHTYIIPTKRPERIGKCLYEKEGNYHLGGGDWLPNVWFLASVENQEMADKRIPELLKLREYGDWPVLGVSVEPMLGLIDWEPWIKLDWIVVGAESGNQRRPCNLEWVKSLYRHCISARIPLWVKQLHIDGRLVKDINQFPTDLQIREYPK